MLGKVKTFNTETGHGTIETDVGIQYFFTHMDCTSLYSPEDIEPGDNVEFELRYAAGIPIACQVDLYYDYEGGYN